MLDMLVKLYDLDDNWAFLKEQENIGITIRKPIGPEKLLIIDWARERFSDAWASEIDVAISNRPQTCFVAIGKNDLLGFACYDATALGMFGPIGVDNLCRGKGTGRALLMACLLDMKLHGYGYAIIGQSAAPKFFADAAGAVDIPDSSPSIWKTWMQRD